MRTQKGFSLIELLIVVAIILIIAAIAIPNLLQARLAANEASAVGSLGALKGAEFTYFNTYPTIGYANIIGDLGGLAPCTPAPTTACLIDSFLATGGATINTAFVAGAAPITMNKSGNRDFCSTNDGVLRSQMGSPGDTPANALATCYAYPVAQ